MGTLIGIALIVGLGAMGTLISIALIVALLLQIFWQANRKNQTKNGSASNTRQSVELNQIQARIREKQQQQKIKRQQRQKARQAEALSQEQERIRQAQLLAQETKSNSDSPTESTQQEPEQNQQAELLIKQAKRAIAQDSEAYDPFNTDLLLAAIEYYRQSYALISQDSYLQAIDSLQIEIDRRQEFKSLFQTATEFFDDKYFEFALSILFIAQKLYSPPQLVKKIAECEDLVRDEKDYVASLDRAKQLSHAGEFNDALNIITLAAAKFSRQDGTSLQVKLNRVIAATEQLKLGNNRQKSGDINAAKYHYSAALQLVPDWKEPQLKLAMIEAQTGETAAAIDRLAQIADPETKCLEGLLHTQRGEYATASEIWSKLNRDLVREYWQLISNETIEQCRLIQPQIKQLVECGELEQARTVSLEFISQFGGDSLIETNLTNCILPAIEAKIWKTADWQKIAIFAHENWVSQPSIRSLHNWAIALYYASQIDGNLEQLMVAWPTAIANINLESTLQNLPWRGGKPVDLTDLSDRLWQLLEQRIEATKDTNLTQYLDLRDRYRQEFWAMQLAQQQLDAKIMVGALTILPSCYQKHYPQISLGEDSKIWKTLYTNWGKAVAACLAGDPQRSELIKTDLVINSYLEYFASNFISYRQGCYYLQQEDWRRAIYPLNDAITWIAMEANWSQEVDELCANHRRKIFDFDEHIDFSRFWYDLLASDLSQVYYVEYQALKIQSDWSNSVTSDWDSLSKIQDLRDTYPQHSIAQEIFTLIYHHWLDNSSLSGQLSGQLSG